MTLSFAPERLRRHDLVHVDPDHWRRMVDERADLVGDPLVASWAGQGLPLVARRRCGEAGTMIALGLPLPPSAGKRRLAFEVPPTCVSGSRRPFTLDEACSAAPIEWSPAIARLQRLAERNGNDVRVFGSLAWAAITSLDYLSSTSDLDLLISLPARSGVPMLTGMLADVQGSAPMRLDGELVRNDGSAANWREVHDQSPELLVKSLVGVAMMPTADFLDQQ